jgi:hypothetical protein
MIANRVTCFIVFRCSLIFLVLATAIGWTFPTAAVHDGDVDKRALKKFPGVLWAKGTDRMSILSANANERFLRVLYPQKKWGSGESGASFLVELPPQREYRCSYRVRFPAGFDFVKGGKLPGLAGGTATTGMQRPNGDGWSARFMWRSGGELVLYLYHLDQAERQGDDIPLSVRVPTNKWVRLTQTVTVNDPGQANGQVRVWIDDTLVLHRQGLRLSVAKKAPVDRFYFSTFYGGKGDQWAPKSDQHIDFTDFDIR